MIEVVYYAAMSLDGFIAGPNGEIDWLNKYMATGEDYGFAEFNASIQAILMGRGTYEKSLQFETWPTGDMPCWVFSSHLTESDIPAVQMTPQAPGEAIRQISEAGIKRAWLMGGGKLAASFLKAGLIHEYDIAIIPEILGDGIPILEPVATQAQQLKLVDSKIHPSGVVQLKYVST